MKAKLTLLITLLIVQISFAGLNEQQPKTIENVKIDIPTSKTAFGYTFKEETKKILGYKCNLVVLTKTDGSEYKIWFTSELVDDNKILNRLGLKGTILCLENDTKSITANKIEFDNTIDKKISIVYQIFNVLNAAQQS